jgi:hypothetical protein
MTFNVGRVLVLNTPPTGPRRHLVPGARELEADQTHATCRRGQRGWVRAVWVGVRPGDRPVPGPGPGGAVVQLPLVIPRALRLAVWAHTRCPPRHRHAVLCPRCSVAGVKEAAAGL